MGNKFGSWICWLASAVADLVKDENNLIATLQHKLTKVTAYK